MTGMAGQDDMTRLESSAIRKRDAWAAREGTETYVQEMGGYALRRDSEIVAELIGRGPGRLLDMPCGTGRFLDLEERAGFSIVAADYSPTMLRVAREHAGVEFVQADAFAPPFAPDSFDVALICRLLFHYDRPERIIAALLPSLKVGGRMVFDTLNPFSMRWAASQALRLFRRDPARRLYFERRGAFRRKLEEMGLTVDVCRSVYILPTRLHRYLPGPVNGAIDCLERLVVPGARVLTYWRATRKA